MACHPGLSNATQHADAAQWHTLGDTAGFITVYPNAMPIVPGNNNRLWNAYNQPSSVADYDDVGFLNGLLDQMIQRYAVDTCRIYMSGFSSGAMMTFRMTCDLTHRFAAVAPVSGGWGYGVDGLCGDGNCDGDVAPGCTWEMAYVNCQPSGSVPLIFIKGSLEGDNLPTCRGTTDSLSRLFWSGFLQCAGSFLDTLQLAGKMIVREQFKGCSHDLAFLSVIGNGHQWHAPATEILWSFFKQHTRCSSAAGLPETIQKSRIDVYPNPAIDRMHVRGTESSGRFEIRDMTGRMLSVGNWSTEGIPVAGLAPGVYLLRLQPTEGPEVVLKFIKDGHRP
jgi:hypothetical protein